MRFGTTIVAPKNRSTFTFLFYGKLQFSPQLYHSDPLPIDMSLGWARERQGGSSVVLSKYGNMAGFTSQLNVDVGPRARAAAVATNSGDVSANDLADVLVPIENKEPQG